MTSSDQPTAPRQQAERDSFQLSPGMVVLGIVAIVVGIVCGFVMSSATFLR